MVLPVLLDHKDQSALVEILDQWDLKVVKDLVETRELWDHKV
jgi:hypothetical protein